MRRLAWLILASCGSAVNPGAPDAGGGGEADAKPIIEADAKITPPVELAGIWQPTSGNLSSPDDTEFGTLKFMVLDGDGTGTFYTESASLHVKGQASLLWARLD